MGVHVFVWGGVHTYICMFVISVRACELRTYTYCVCVCVSGVCVCVFTESLFPLSRGD